MVNLGARIKELREGLGLNQADFANKLGLGGPTVISRYEKEQRDPEIDTLVKVAKLANISLGWLITGEGSKYRKETKAEEVTLKKVIEFNNDIEYEFVEKLFRIFRTKDDNTILAIKQNIDQFLRVPDKEEAAQAAEEKAPKRKRRAVG